MQISYETIKPLLAGSKIEGDVITCFFQVPGGGSTIEASSRIEKASSETPLSALEEGLDALKKAATYTVQRIIDREGKEEGEELENTISFSDQEKQHAIVEAFKQISNQLVFDKNKKEWQYRSELTDYELQLAQQPVEKEYDRIILERLLVELAKVHEGINRQEEAYLTDLLGGDADRLQQLQQESPVSKTEAEAVTEAVRPTIYMLVYTIAVVDHHLDDRELALLHDIAEKFGFQPQVEELLASAAKNHVFENALSMDFTHEQLFDLAEQLRLTKEESEKLLSQFNAGKE